MGREGADTLVHPHKARRWVEQRAVGKGDQGRLESRPQARKPAPQRTRHGGHRKNKPQRTRRTRRWEKRGRLEVEGAVVRATPPALAVEGVGKPGQVVGVWLCRRDRRHGKPGGLLHLGRRGDWVEERPWVKGAQAGWKAGRRLESLPHIGHDTEGTEKTNHRGHGGHGEKQTTEDTEDTEMGKEAARSAQRRRARVSRWAD